MTLETLKEIVAQLGQLMYIKQRPATDEELGFNVHDAYVVVHAYPEYAINKFNFSSCYYGNCHSTAEHTSTCDMLTAFDKWCEKYPRTAKSIFRIAYDIAYTESER